MFRLLQKRKTGTIRIGPSRKLFGAFTPIVSFLFVQVYGRHDRLKHRRSVLSVFYGNNLLATVISTVLAYPVCKLTAVALRAFNDTGNGKLPVR